MTQSLVVQINGKFIGEFTPSSFDRQVVCNEALAYAFSVGHEELHVDTTKCVYIPKRLVNLIPKI